MVTIVVSRHLIPTSPSLFSKKKEEPHNNRGHLLVPALPTSQFLTPKEDADRRVHRRKVFQHRHRRDEGFSAASGGSRGWSVGFFGCCTKEFPIGYLWVENGILQRINDKMVFQGWVHFKISFVLLRGLENKAGFFTRSHKQAEFFTVDLQHQSSWILLIKARVYNSRTNRPASIKRAYPTKREKNKKSTVHKSFPKKRPLPKRSQKSQIQPWRPQAQLPNAGKATAAQVLFCVFREFGGIQHPTTRYLHLTGGTPSVFKQKKNINLHPLQQNKKKH